MPQVSASTVATAVVLTGGLLLSGGCAGEATSLPETPQLFLTTDDPGEPRQLTDSSAHHSGPAWSPEGRSIAFIASGAGSASVEIVSPKGADEQRSIAGNFSPRTLAWSPDGRRVAFIAVDHEINTTLGVVELDGSGLRVLSRFVSERFVPDGPVWSPDGRRIAFVRPVGRYRRVRGPTRNPAPRPAAGQPRPPPAPSVDARQLKIVVVARKGGAERHLTRERGSEWDPLWSPDGQTILFVRERDRFGGLLDLRRAPATGGPSRAVAASLLSVTASWSADGRRIAFVGATTDERRSHLYVIAAVGGTPRKLAGDVAQVRPAWLLGNELAYVDFDGRVRAVRGDGSTRTLAELPGAEILEVAASPDGRRLAFVAHKRPED
jgi:Tol biopolymer transport system component